MTSFSSRDDFSMTNKHLVVEDYEIKDIEDQTIDNHEPSHDQQKKYLNSHKNKENFDNKNNASKLDQSVNDRKLL